jgi:hypothetical protein
VRLGRENGFAEYPALFGEAFGYLSGLDERGGQKPNYEMHLSARFARIHTRALKTIRKARIPIEEARMFCALPAGGIQDNTVNRLLLMSSSERHLANVPMAFFIEGRGSRDSADR